ncbi:hypothetical protein [Paenibacillus sp. NFR01]|uniref:hypothetical protein n=1 Tax=Paenibacillus sp. NFR01 TaxID=1566279 RepID=UPI0008CD1773|nr:hypothetical protein [Paenibacillus sp. NFR01]SET42796.1 hypothetical protein SAMN03159358_1647 [Paenibacillus sp. NFR01]
MKNRSFWLGLGTGLIAGAVLLQLMLAGGAAPLSKEELQRQAARLGLTVTGPAATEAPAGEADGATPAPSGQPPAEASPQASATAAPSPAASPAAEPSAAASPAAPSAPAQPAASAGTVTPAKPPAAPATPDPAAGTVSVRIPYGSTLTETARILDEAGLIDGTEAFLSAAQDRKVNKIIQYGSYSFPKDATINDMIDRLITIK